MYFQSLEQLSMVTPDGVPLKVTLRGVAVEVIPDPGHIGV